ncbi:YolD-like family protein [Paenibacillus septentrionalis]|uniref:YolD-like family protein n=1 Tax=Paenibacillus septentrionalis TaxID=429342 RepID=A0ABW1V199_9BACL
MSKKLQGNGLFESSRMMLPEHKEAIIAYHKEMTKKQRPQLDEQEIGRISMLLTESMRLKKQVVLVVFAEYNRTELTGVVTKVNHLQKSIQLSLEEDDCWIKIHDIIDIRSSDF